MNLNEEMIVWSPFVRLFLTDENLNIYHKANRKSGRRFPDLVFP